MRAPTRGAEPTVSKIARRQQADADRDERARALFVEAAESPLESRRYLHQKIVVEYLGVAESIARRYAGGHGDGSDLRQVAYLGLVKAVKRFDLSKGDDFIAYCVPTISGEIKRYLRDHGWFVRPPRSVQDLHGRIGEVYPRLMQALGREPSPEDLAADLDADVDHIAEALRSREGLRPFSLDGVSAGSAETPSLIELLGHTDPRLERVETRASIASACSRLSARERRILYLRYFEERTQAQIGRELNVTQMQVSRLLKQILQQLREGASIQESAGGGIHEAGQQAT